MAKGTDDPVRRGLRARQRRAAHWWAALASGVRSSAYKEDDGKSGRPTPRSCSTGKGQGPNIAQLAL